LRRIDATKGDHMRLSIIVFALLASITAATASVPNMTCKAESGVAGPEGQPQEVTDSFRVADGRLYHQWSGRGEYLYNRIVEIEFGRYSAGHMVFVMGYDGRRGYVVIAAPTDWRVVYVNCGPA
jgi:hypothetical protein